MRPTTRFVALLTAGLVMIAGGLACGSDDKASSSTYCEVIEKWDKLAKSDDGGGLTEENFFDTINTAMREVEAAAPAEIKDDVRYTFASYKASMFKPVGEGNRPKVGESYDKAKVEAANARLDKYTKEHCGID